MDMCKPTNPQAPRLKTKDTGRKEKKREKVVSREQGETAGGHQPFEYKIGTVEITSLGEMPRMEAFGR